MLRYQATRIADYEALYHIYLWEHESEPRYIYYIGQSKQFEKWYNNVEKDPIYKEIEEKSTFTEHVFKEVDYDRVSIWKYDDIEAINKQIQEAENKIKCANAQIEELNKKLKDIQKKDQ